LLEKQIVVVSKDKAEGLIEEWEAKQAEKRAAATRNPTDDQIAEDELEALADSPVPKRRSSKKASNPSTDETED
jgi:hypothetical protein